jgi:hypothetical protein
MSYPMESIICEQHFSRKSLGFLWSKREQLDPSQRSILDSLYKGRSKGTIEGVFNVEYRLPKTGVGKLGFGRCYGTKGSLETLERECRGTICRDFYDDIDVVNCHPVLLYQFAQHMYQVELPEVQKYCDNRTEYLTQIHESREEAKQAIIKVFYNGKNDYMLLTPMVTEIRSFIKNYLMTDPIYAELLAYVRSKEANTYGSFLSHILQTEERKVMIAIRQSFMVQGFNVDVLTYDGVMVRKGVKRIAEENLRIAEEDIFHATRYRIQLLNKPFDFFKMDEYHTNESIEVAPKVLKRDYEAKKIQFEISSFYYNPTNTVITWDGKQLLQCSTEKAVLRFVEYDFNHSEHLTDKTSFIKLWLNDPSRRMISEINMKPSDDPMVFSPPFMYRYQTIEVLDKNQYIIELFEKLLSVVCNHHTETYHYVRSWLAHLIQRPFENPKTAIFLTGRKGCGKDTLGDFIIQWLVGNTYAHNYESTDQFWDKYDTARENRLFVKVEEVEGAINRQYASKFKSRITAFDITVNPKGDKPRTSSHYCRYFGTTNEPQPWKTEDNERRAFVIPCSFEWVGKHEIWTNIRETLFCPDGAATVGRWLEELDIESWDPRKIPVTEYMIHSAEAETTSEASFISIWDGMECEMKSLYEKYVAHCQDKKIHYASNSKSFGIKLLEFIRDGVIHKRRTENGMMYSKK